MDFNFETKKKSRLEWNNPCCSFNVLKVTEKTARAWARDFTENKNKRIKLYFFLFFFCQNVGRKKQNKKPNELTVAKNMRQNWNEYKNCWEVILWKFENVREFVKNYCKRNNKNEIKQKLSWYIGEGGWNLSFIFNIWFFMHVVVVCLNFFAISFIPWARYEYNKKYIY